MIDWVGKVRRALGSPVGMAMLVGTGIIVGLIAGGGSEESNAPASSGAHASHQHERGASSTYTCSMHSQIRQDGPGQCPICGMDLVEVSSSNSSRTDDAATLSLSPRARALARVQTTVVHRRGDAASVIRLLGRIEASETTKKSVTAWTSGRIDRLYVNTTGERVRAGQTIATLYSPEIFAAHQDLIVAKRQVTQMSSSSEANQAAALAMFAASKERLQLLGVPNDEVKKMETQSEPTRQVRIRTPFTGTVLKRVATEGAYVKTGAPLYLVANLSKLWVQLDAYESDLSRLEKGQAVAVFVDARPGQVFHGKVMFIDPQLDVRRRTARVRVEVDNASGELRPGMFVSAEVSQGTSEEAQPLVIPSTAPLFTGRRSVVFVETNTGETTSYEARTVRLGPRLDHDYPVVAGLAEGERVVSRGAFAIDADLQIRGGHSMMTLPDDSQKAKFDSVVEMAVSERRQLAPIVTRYLDVQAALASDDLATAKRAADAIGQAVERGASFKKPSAATAWRKIKNNLIGHSAHVARAKDIEGAREGFEKLSLAVQSLVEQFGNPLKKDINLAFCPMASGSGGATWMQIGDVVDNSYFGASMKRCGEIRQTIAPNGFLAPQGSSTTAGSAKGHQH